MTRRELPAVEELGEMSWLLRFDLPEDEALAAVHACHAALRDARLPWIAALVPAYATLLVGSDPGHPTPPEGRRAELQQWLARHARGSPSPTGGYRHELPMTVDADSAPDLAEVAALCGLSTGEVLGRFLAPEYLVAMIGFAPGFPYLRGLDPRLTVPRLATPRLAVPAGSVAIAAGQAAIYPQQGPGGWRLIGRTPASLFDPHADPPCRFAPGDRLRFVLA